MAQEVKVSVIVPVYNVEKYLKRCLDSITKQTLKEIEIICINDGSTDNSLEILQQYACKDSRIHIIDKQNEGLSVARNTGMKIATGEYIGFIDSDDWVDLEFFEKLYLSAKKNETDVAVGEIVRLHKFHRKKHLKIEKETVTNKLTEKFEICEVPDKYYVWNKIYKSDKLKEFNITFEPGIIYEDVIFTPQIFDKLGKLVAVPGVSYYYWRRPDSLVKQKSQQAQKDQLYVRQYIEKFFADRNLNIKDFEPKTKTYKFLGINVFRIQTQGARTIYRLFNAIRWEAKRGKV